MHIKIDLKIFVFLLLFLLIGQVKIYALLIGFALLHEIGHLIMGLVVGLQPKEMKITPVGISITFQNEIGYYTPNQKMLKEIAVAIAGPLVNIVVVILCCIFPFPSSLIWIVNLVLAIINLLPIYPLDGGRIVKSIVARLHSDEETEAYMHTISNTMLIILTIVCSVVILYYHNIALLVAIAYLWWIVIKEHKQYHLWKQYREKIHK